MSCINCKHWGVDERGIKHDALLRPIDSKWVHKLCLKQTKVAAKYTHSKFNCEYYAGVIHDVLPCPYCKTTKYVEHNTHGLNDQCWKCGAYVRKPYLTEQL